MRLFPTREQAKSSMESEVVADLDSLLTSTVSFKLHGKIHEISPITTLDFLKFTNSLAKLDLLREKAKLTPEDLITAYFDLCNSLVPTITREDISQMTQGQVAAMLQLLIDTVMGRMNDEKKKTIEMKAAQ